MRVLGRLAADLEASMEAGAANYTENLKAPNISYFCSILAFLFYISSQR